MPTASWQESLFTAIGWGTCQSAIVFLSAILFVALWRILWALAFSWILKSRSARSMSFNSPDGNILLSDTDSDYELPLAAYPNANSPPLTISLILPSRSSEIQQLQIVRQAREDKHSVARQAREAAFERATLGSLKSLRVPVSTLHGNLQ